MLPNRQSIHIEATQISEIWVLLNMKNIIIKKNIIFDKIY